MHEYDFIAIDFEIANNNMNSACSVGIAAVKDLKIVESEYHLIKPPTDNFRKENTEVHGITLDDVKNADSFPIIWEKIKKYFGSFVIAHNAHFDMSVLKNSFDTYDMEIPQFYYLDSITISNTICSTAIGTSLKDRTDYFSIDLQNHHNALEDATACANIVICSIKAGDMISLADYINKYYTVNPHSFSDIKANKTFNASKRPAYSNVKISDIVATTTTFNKKHPFYKKNIVLTGELTTLDRKEAMQKIVDVGGLVKSGVSSVTHYLVVGRQDKKLVGEDGLSGKEEKVYDLISQGYKIKIINEEEFIKLLSE
ncbi:exonuclease domain-containing protein [Anaerocolumna sp. MB42-C2]|uniref:exonuclease domain-containing protein n=1 Tax=Anaerocolumna sp. MB42-C2 TaxID=3070997 RepID=UPI0027DF4299|nr:exonuclease domain-containing protein [Anaerocolumna sp. MB42-C2]WMJ88901.1 exonuclease domain-containing protein [Anaerocolumna sp. MB42-C2]